MEKQAPKRTFGSSASRPSSQPYERPNHYDYDAYAPDHDGDLDSASEVINHGQGQAPIQWLPDDAIEYLPNNRALTVRPNYQPAVISRTKLSARGTFGLIALFISVLGGGFLLRNALQGATVSVAAAASPASAMSANLPITSMPKAAPAGIAVGPVVAVADGVKIALPMPPTATPPNFSSVGLPKAAATVVASDSATAARIAGGLQPIYAPSASLSDGLPTYICSGQSTASFATLIQMQMSGRDVAHGFHLGLVPFGLSSEIGFDSVARAQADSALRRGDWDCELTSVDQVARVGHGVITLLADSSAGADGIWSRAISATNTLGVSALRGKRVGYVRQSPAEYFLRYTLTISQINPETGITLLPYDTVSESVAAFNGGEIDAVAAWQPGIAPMVAAGGRPVLTTERFRTVTHVIATSRYAIESKPELVQAFHNAWFETLKAQAENVPLAASQIAAWGNPQWLGIRNSRVVDSRVVSDTRAALLRVAQADLSDNTRVMSRPIDLLMQIETAQALWRASGQSVALGASAALIDSRFVMQAAQNDALVTLRPPVNDSYTSRLPPISGLLPLPTSAQPTPTALAVPQAPVALPTAVGVATPVAPATNANSSTARQTQSQPQLQSQSRLSGQTTLPCRRFDFLPDSAVLTDASRELLDRCVLPLLRQNPGAQLRLVGSAAWPGPKGTYTEDQIRSLARARAQAIADYVASQQIDPQRLKVDAVVPPLERREVDDILVQSQDRYVEMTLIPAARS